MSSRGDLDYHLTLALAATTSVYPAEIRLRPGLLDAAGPLIAHACSADYFAIISDSQVVRHYGDRLLTALSDAGLAAALFSFPAGEWNKTRESWADLADRLFRAGVGGGGAIVGLGGGVTMALAGFVAATFLDGLPCVQVPTTLAAMVGGAVGGVTALDTTAGKNLIATTCVPRLVLIDPSLLSTLPAPQLAAGLAEAFRHALVLDRGYFAELVAGVEATFGRDPEVVGRLIQRALELRAGALARAETEAGYGQVLDFGGTVGRALESVMGYGWLPGEALAVGMVAQAALGVALGATEADTTERVRQALESACLPVEPDEDLTRERFLEALERERRRSQAGLRYTLLREVGAAAVTPEGGWGWETPADRVVAALFAGGP